MKSLHSLTIILLLALGCFVTQGWAWRPLTWKAHGGRIDALAFSPDGQRLASAGFGAEVRLWDVSSRKLLHTIRGVGIVKNGLGFTAAGINLVCVNGTNGLSLQIDRLNTITGALSPKSGPVSSFSANSSALSHDGKFYAVCGAYDTGNPDPSYSVGRSAVETGSIIKGRLHSLYSNNGVGSVAFSPDGKTLAAGSYEKILFWNFHSGKSLPMRKITKKGWVNTLAYSPDGRLIAGVIDKEGTDSETLHIWDAATGPEQQVFKRATGIFTFLFLPNSQSIIIGASNGTIDLWNIKTGKLKRALFSRRDKGVLATSPYGKTGALAISPDGSTLAIGGNGTITLQRIR